MNNYQVPPPKEVAMAMEDQNTEVGKKRIRSPSSNAVPKAKKSKADAEVEGILENSTLSHGIPGLDEIISAESKRIKVITHLRTLLDDSFYS